MPFQLTINDSNDPSYTDLVLPYRVICRQRYRRARVHHRRQFIKEIMEHELLQTKALDGVRIHREFCSPYLCPDTFEDVARFTVKQKRRLDEILKTEYDE